MKLLAALVLSIALSGSALAGTLQSEPRLERRDTAASQRQVTCPSCERDSHGRIRRHSTARRDFQREHPCPSAGATSDHAPATSSITSYRSSSAGRMSQRTCSGIGRPRPKQRISSSSSVAISESVAPFSAPERNDVVAHALIRSAGPYTVNDYRNGMRLSRFGSVTPAF